MVKFVRGSDTSQAAAQSIESNAATMRGMIYVAIKRKEKLGATCDEVEELLNMRHQTASARIREMAQQGLLHDSGARRLTRSKRMATVWETT
jgi:Mn-dependent DtxR family transcriptional regulator